MKESVLVSAIGGDLSQSVAQCIRNDLPKVKLIGTDTNINNASSFFVDKFIQIAHSKSEEYLTNLKEIIAEEKPTFYIPLSEPELRILSKLEDVGIAELLGDTKLVWVGSKLLRIFLDKTESMDFISRLGIGTPISYNIDKLEDVIFPVIVKPRFGSGSKQLFVCNNVMELNSALTFVDKPIIQEYIPDSDNEYTVGVFSTGKGLIHSICFRRYLAPGGHTSWCEVVNDEEISSISESLAVASELVGSFNVQLRKHEGKYYIFEVNPRFSSTALIRSQLGFKDVIWSLGYQLPSSKFRLENPISSKFAVVQKIVSF